MAELCLHSPICLHGIGSIRMSIKNLASLSRDEVKNLFSSIDTILTDCDGVLWLHMKILPGAPDVLNKFREMGKRVFYITNNNVITREEFCVKCDKLGFTSTKDDVLTTSYLTACYLHDIGFKKKVYVVGTSGISRELSRLGIRSFGVGPDPLISDVATLVMKDFKLDPDVGAVIVGFDEYISYPKILKAASYLNHPDCLFIATNTDERGPSFINDCVIPGTGSMVAAIETCAGRKPFLIGKPSTYIIDAIRKRYNVDPERTLMIGDRCNTDILLGTRCGFKTLLVLSGVNTLDDVMNWKQSDNEEDRGLVPDYYIGKLGDLLPLLT
ncbi:glycerol-3-phosphate phosphatase isoform X3 [Cryptotermes secundus]|uniref:glycerol-3-phosphate phosphatase isoform X3 n=1 Tax=Cryptotermes secundus TaxID=105785 RepID=UPI001454C60A|nr:glycerol-3-phosphate phosphatase isoform X3 [Cryptotermes secundus]